MSCRLFHRLRRCRALFALALCAWLTLAGVAWAQQGCCASMGDSAGMGMAHAMGSPDHAPGHPASPASDGACAHVTASVPPLLAQQLPPSSPPGPHWRVYREAAPQPLYEPPLRPPVA
ncbi:hypothetical protein [Dyella sp. RRB7]|uniref:hypothetical protein n=1 Tax=Dyella sp. RRB7 TaxID=2919502 RepID=UPI001FAA5204|nr:hypothetical protein [Dyella sp. RRB7]